MNFYHLLQKLKLPATSCGESPTVKDNFIFIRSLTPLQATGLTLAVQFNRLKTTEVIVNTLDIILTEIFTGLDFNKDHIIIS